MPRTLVLRPCAKINLTLCVGDLRADGYHDVETLLQSVLLSDRLTFERRRGPFVLSTRTTGVPADRTNLVWRAADALWRAMGRTDAPRDVHVTLNKRIPVAAGLGGGSADAAAALVGLNALWRGGVSRRALGDLAATLGADVPFFLEGGTARGTDRGDVLSAVEDVRRMSVVIVVPSFGVSAAQAYRWLDDDRRDRALKKGRRATGQHIDVGWTTGPVQLENDLEAVVVRRHPEVGEMIEACRRSGALGAAMTGSGSAVFSMFRRPPGEAILERLRTRGWRVIRTRTATRQEASSRISV